MPIPEPEPEIFYEELLPIDGDFDYSSPGGETDFFEDLYDEDFDIGTYDEQFYSTMDAENKKAPNTKPQAPKPKPQPTKPIKTKKEDFPPVILPPVFLPSEGNHKDKKIADKHPPIILPPVYEDPDDEYEYENEDSYDMFPSSIFNDNNEDEDDFELFEIPLQYAPTPPKSKVQGAKPALPPVLAKPPYSKTYEDDYEVFKIPLEVTPPLNNVNAKVNVKPTYVTDDENEDEYEIFKIPLQVAPTPQNPKYPGAKPVLPPVLAKLQNPKNDGDDYEVFKIPLEVTPPPKNVNDNVDDENEEEYELFEIPLTVTPALQSYEKPVTTNPPSVSTNPLPQPPAQYRSPIPVNVPAKISPPVPNYPPMQPTNQPSSPQVQPSRPVSMNPSLLPYQARQMPSFRPLPINPSQLPSQPSRPMQPTSQSTPPAQSSSSTSPTPAATVYNQPALNFQQPIRNNLFSNLAVNKNFQPGTTVPTAPGRPPAFTGPGRIVPPSGHYRPSFEEPDFFDIQSHFGQTETEDSVSENLVQNNFQKLQQPAGNQDDGNDMYDMYLPPVEGNNVKNFADFFQQQSVPQQPQQAAQNQFSGNQRFQQTSPVQNNFRNTVANNQFQNQR